MFKLFKIFCICFIYSVVTQPALADSKEEARKALKAQGIPYSAKEYLKAAAFGKKETVNLFLISGIAVEQPRMNFLQTSRG